MAASDKGVPVSYFFADPSTFSQEEWRAFGPRGGNNDERANQFSLTSAFGSWTDVNAYAICKGVVFVQPQTDSEATMVNLVLRPIDQPFPGLNVKYFVYRGLRKADFFDGDKVLASGPDTSDLVHTTNAAFASFYAAEETMPDFLAKYIGYDPSNQDGSLLLDDFFFKKAGYTAGSEDVTKAFELPVVQGGSSLGRFVNNGTFGVDVVLDHGDFHQSSDDDQFIFNLSYVRSWRAELNFWWLLAPGFEHKRKRQKEQVFQFIDIVSFYGAHAADGIVKTKIGGVWYNKTGNAIYSDLLDTCFSKNRLYLYIQSDRTRSYNFYNNYVIDETNDNTLKIGPTVLSAMESKYQTDGWPLLINEVAQNHNNDNNALFIQFPKTPNNVNAMLYGQVADIVNDQENNFCGTDDLSLPDELDGTAALWTKVIELQNPATGASGSKLNIATFNILIYQGRTISYLAGQELNEENVSVPVYAVPNFFDDVFDLLDSTPVIKSEQVPLYSVLTNKKVKLINNYYNQKQFGISAVQTTKINDAIATDEDDGPFLKRVTYITETIDNLTNATAIGGKTSNDTKSSPALAGARVASNTYELPTPFYYERVLFTDSTETITGLRVKAVDDTIPDKILLGLTQAEDLILAALILTNGLRNVRLFLIDLFEDGNELISAENITYQKYKVGIVGEKWDGVLEFFMPADDIMVYSLDRKYHYTQQYSAYMKEFLNVELAIDLDIAL